MRVQISESFSFALQKPRGERCGQRCTCNGCCCFKFEALLPQWSNEAPAPDIMSVLTVVEKCEGAHAERVSSAHAPSQTLICLRSEARCCRCGSAAAEGRPCNSAEWPMLQHCQTVKMTGCIAAAAPSHMNAMPPLCWIADVEAKNLGVA